MAVRSPQFDNRVRGGADAWDEGQAGAILAADYFPAQASSTEASVTVTGPAPAITATAEVSGGAVEASASVTGPSPSIAATAASTVAGQASVTGPAPSITATGASSVAASVALQGALPSITATVSGGVAVEMTAVPPGPLVEATAEAIGGPVEPPAEPQFGWGGGINADREWFEREEAEERERQRQDAERILAAVRSLPETQQEATPRASAAQPLLTLATPVPAPLRRNGAGPRLTFAILADALRQWAANRDRIAAEEAERQAIAFALEQQRLAEEAAARQLALDDEAAEALFALLMND